MASVNIVLIAGNLTRDPEVRYTPSGMAVSQLGVAVNRKTKDNQSGQWKDETTFVDVDVFGRQAETVGQYLSKGRSVLIEGRLRLDQWEDKNSGQRRSKLKVIANRVQFLGSPSGGGGGGEGGGGGGRGGEYRQQQAPPAQSAPPPQQQGGLEEANLEIADENIPF